MPKEAGKKVFKNLKMLEHPGFDHNIPDLKHNYYEYGMMRLG